MPDRDAARPVGDSDRSQAGDRGRCQPGIGCDTARVSLPWRLDAAPARPGRRRWPPGLWQRPGL